MKYPTIQPVWSFLTHPAMFGVACREAAGIPRALVQGMVGHSAGQMTGHYSEAVATPEQIATITRRQTVDGKLKNCCKSLIARVAEWQTQRT